MKTLILILAFFVIFYACKDNVKPRYCFQCVIVTATRIEPGYAINYKYDTIITCVNSLDDAPGCDPKYLQGPNACSCIRIK